MSYKNRIKSVTVLPFWKKIIFSLLPCFILFFSLELILRITGFYFSTTPLFIGLPELIPKQYSIFRKDKWLLWSLSPENKAVNSYGFIGKEVDLSKPENTIRIVCLGDSCTMLGDITYPQYIENILREKIKDRNIEVINAGCGSYSSLQGLRLLQIKIGQFRPDYVSIFFGWNDHWIALSEEDKDIDIQSDLAIKIKSLLNKSRVYQLLVKWMLTLKDEINNLSHPPPELDGGFCDMFYGKEGKKYPAKPRVSSLDYRNNLNQMVEICRDINAIPILLTAPTNLDVKNPSLKRLCQYGLFPVPELFNKVHSRYNDIVRETAMDQKVILLDLEDIMRKLANGGKYFKEDGMHFTARGRSFVARKLSEVILGDLGYSGSEYDIVK